MKYFYTALFSFAILFLAQPAYAGTTYDVDSCADLQAVDNAAPYDPTDIVYLTGSFSCDVVLGDVSDFNATFDGQGNTITLTGDDSLFDTLSGATVQNLIIAGDIDGGGLAYVSALATTAENETLIYRVGVIADITNSSSYSAGFVFSLDNSIIRDSFHTGSVESTGSYTAGFAAFVRGGSVIERVFSEGSVSGASYVGGIAGLFDRVGSPQIVRDSFFSGSATSTNNLAGAVVGLIDDFLTPDESEWLDNNYYNAASIGDDICAQASPDVTSTAGVCVAVNTIGDPDPFYFIDNNDEEPMASWDFDTVWYAQTPHPRLVVALSPGTSVPGQNSGSGWNYTHPPLCSATFSPNTITKGESTTLSWNTTWPTERENNYYTKVPGEGLYSQNVQSLTLQPQHTTEYTIAVFNLWGANFCQAQITVLDENGEEITSNKNSNLTASAISSGFFRPLISLFSKIFVR
jgi:hypothetical protein